jgi:magnesium chelatase family protein
VSVATVKSRAELGFEAPRVTVEVFLSGGLPSFSIVGMAETAVRESKDRVRSALISSGFRFPQERITVSLAPAAMPKTGGRFDLAIALGILAASRQVPPERLCDTEFYGELALTGELRPVPAILPAALKARAAGMSVVVPTANGAEAALADVMVRTAATLLHVSADLLGRQPLEPLTIDLPAAGSRPTADLADVRGQVRARRALEIAAAGGHNLLMIGPPGTGKSMLARRLPGILPPMTAAEALETAAIESILGRPVDTATWRCRPFRAPHHTASAIALVGGGRAPRPGEISRAHNGVLFLDELPEFNRNVLEVLREPLESGTIAISRAEAQAEFPARFQLVAAMNPCPCGYLGEAGGDCGCSAERVRTYRGKVSGPLVDRIDLHVEVGRPDAATLQGEASPAESSAVVAQRVSAARGIQLERAGVANALLEGPALAALCKPDRGGQRLLERAVDRLRLSARAYHRVLRVARTIADLANEPGIAPQHVAEALTLRQLDQRRR